MQQYKFVFQLFFNIVKFIDGSMAYMRGFFPFFPDKVRVCVLTAITSSRICQEKFTASAAHSPAERAALSVFLLSSARNGFFHRETVSQPQPNYNILVKHRHPLDVCLNHLPAAFERPLLQHSFGLVKRLRELFSS